MFISPHVIGQLKAGEISDNVIKIELTASDAIEEFHEGFAVIRKGQSTAMIDKFGKFLIPFNKYTSTGRFINGYSMVFKGGTYGTGFIDKEGKEVIPCRYYMAWNADKNGLVVLDSFNKRIILDLKSLKRYNFNNTNPYQYKSGQDRFYDPAEIIYFSNGLTPFLDSKSNRYGYRNISGNVIINPQFFSAEPFSEGLAAVSKTNEFGEVKFGFINITGKTIIPFNFSKAPRSFYNNRAYVEPTDYSEFYFGYINQKGDLKIKLNRSQVRSSKDFNENYIIIVHDNNLNTRQIVDTNGIEIPFPKVLKYADKEYHYGVNDNIVNGQLMVTAGFQHGIINLKGEIIIPPIFTQLSYIDPDSRLAKASFSIGNNKYVEGYVNENGVFVIIKAQTSKW